MADPVCSPLLYASPGLVYTPEAAAQSQTFPAAQIRERLVALTSQSGESLIC